MLNRILQTSAIVALLLLSLVLWDLHQLVREARVSLLLTDPVLGNINAAASNLTTAAGAIGVVAQSANAGLVAETKRLNAGTLELQKTEASLRLLLVRTDRNLNDELLPKASQVLSSTKVTIDALQPSLAASAQATQRLDDLLGSPAIPTALDGLSASATNLQHTTADA